MPWAARPDAGLITFKHYGVNQDDTLCVEVERTVLMKKRGRCCGCFPNVISIIVDVTERYHREIETPDDKIIPFIQKIQAEHQRCETVRMLARQAKMRRAAA